jgi:hypothetical protein
VDGYRIQQLVAWCGGCKSFQACLCHHLSRTALLLPASPCCRNFAAGGDWIIQPALSNSAALAALLPHDAPLSTLRVVTASIAWLQQQAAQQGGLQDSNAQQQEHRSLLQSHGDSPRAAASPRGQQQQHDQQLHSSLSVPGARDQQQVTAERAGALRQRQRPSGAAAAGGAGGSSGGVSQPQVQLPVGTYRPGPETPPLPVSAGVMRLLNIEGRCVCGQRAPVLDLLLSNTSNVLRTDGRRSH